jgi:hypothetical protein
VGGREGKERELHGGGRRGKRERKRQRTGAGVKCRAGDDDYNAQRGDSRAAVNKHAEHGGVRGSAGGPDGCFAPFHAKAQAAPRVM